MPHLVNIVAILAYISNICGISFPIFAVSFFQLLWIRKHLFIDMVVLFGKEKTKEYSGITKNFFGEYFKDRKVAYAYKLGKIKVYDEPKTLTEFGLRVAPQSFAYAK